MNLSMYPSDTKTIKQNYYGLLLTVPKQTQRVTQLHSIIKQSQIIYRYNVKAPCL